MVRGEEHGADIGISRRDAETLGSSTVFVLGTIYDRNLGTAEHAEYAEGCLMMQNAKSPRNRFAILCLAAFAFASAHGAGASRTLGSLGGAVEVSAIRNSDGTWGLAAGGAGSASVGQPRPLEAEAWDEGGGYARRIAAGYATVDAEGAGFVGKGRLDFGGGASLVFEDRWVCGEGVLRVARSVRVEGSAPGGFLTAVTLRPSRRMTWPEVQWFAPGMMYGGFDNLTAHAIGGRAYYQPGSYTVRIREDRLPAPLVMAYFSDDASLAVLNPKPGGITTSEDGQGTQPGTLIDARFRFGAIGGQERDTGPCLGYWFPGTEGETTYLGNTYPAGQIHQWRRRYHPIQDGLEQRYEVAFRFGRGRDFSSAFADAWRWAWQTLKPQVNPQDIGATRRSIVDTLAANTLEIDGRFGIPNALSVMPGAPEHAEPKTVMGFTGKALESAEFLLAESLLADGERAARLRRLGEGIIASFLRLKMAPPEGEGFFIKTGQVTTARGHRKNPEIYLRSFGDDIKALLRAHQRESRHGRDHPEWLARARDFADWLLTQQQPGGGFPRAWLPPDGAVFSDSPNASYCAIPMLVQLADITGERKYLHAAVRAGDFCWANGQDRGRFVGGTIDNPDILDKEAGTLSLEAFLALHRATGEQRWLDRARAAADFAETWIYIWDVPMPEDADDAALHWKKGVSTVGLQLIASGHSLADAYMCFDSDEYARLHRLTGDAHYLDVARILLHNTKAMVALPAHPHDLRGIGWQQEHWSLAPRRGFGLHRLWLPWVATSQLNGIFGLMEFDPALFEELARPHSM